MKAILVGVALALGVAAACAPEQGRPTVPASAAHAVMSLQAIDCESCGGKVVAALRERPGVYDASFHRVRAEVAIAYDPSVTGIDDFVAVAATLGYVGVAGAGHGAYVQATAFDPRLDVATIADAGQAVDLETAVVAGKVTVFDFYAAWCKPCRRVDEHMKAILAESSDVALRKIDIVDWDSEVAAAHLRGVPELPYVIVYGCDGRRVAEISGLHLDRLDDAIEEGRRR